MDNSNTIINQISHGNAIFCVHIMNQTEVKRKTSNVILNNCIYSYKIKTENTQIWFEIQLLLFKRTNCIRVDRQMTYRECTLKKTHKKPQHLHKSKDIKSTMIISLYDIFKTH